MEDTLRAYAARRLRAMTDASYLARAIREMTPVLMASSATEAVAAVLEPGAARDLLRQLAPFSAAVVPLRARGRTVGVVSAFRDIHRTPFTADDVALLEDIGARAALALDNARLYESQRDVSEALQRSMLTPPPHREGLQVVTRYTPAGEAARIGGDWYDAFLQGDGASTPPDIVVVVGDVVGHDVEAAAAMGQVRGLLRGIAVHSGDAPAAILSGLDTVMQSLQLETTATAVVARFEQARSPGHGSAEVLLRWSHAGHPPALLVDAHGTVTRLADADANDLLLGFDPGTDRHEGAVALEAGATLVLYTDGLVERRDRDIEDGITVLEHLLAEMAPATSDLDQLCDRLLGAMASQEQEDDVALLVVRWAPDAA
jgi:serine phosphatase RsbU (regulator of sigma subunit)